MTALRSVIVDGAVQHLDRAPLSRDELAAGVAGHVPRGSYVNLGIGQPTTIADHLRAEQDVTLHTENGMLGMGRQAHGAEIDWDLINAGKIPVTETPGCSYFHHADSFAVIRGGHLDVCVLGAYQVAVNGDLANWHAGDPSAIPAVGGAMDLAAGARSTWVMMSLFTRDGRPKLVPSCTYPLTAAGCVQRVHTGHATFVLGADGAVVTETFGISVEELLDRLGRAQASS